MLAPAATMAAHPYAGASARMPDPGSYGDVRRRDEKTSASQKRQPFADAGDRAHWSDPSCQARPVTCDLSRTKPFQDEHVRAGKQHVAHRTSDAAPAPSDEAGSASRTRHFVTLSYDWHYTQPLHFAEHPLGDLLGTEVASTQFEAYEYRTRDGATAIDVVEFSRRQQGATVTLYPFGMSTGSTLAVRGSIEPLPDVQLVFVGAAPFSSYTLTNARALDAAAGVYVADRAPGWSLGSHAFVLGGIGRITSDLGNGRRYFAEGGGGLSVGPFGVDLSVKFAWNRLHEPVEHRFLTVPVSLRGTLTF